MAANSPRSHQDYWCLYNQKTGELIDQLSTKEARAITRALLLVDNRHWWAWHAGWNGWHMLKRCKALFEKPKPRPVLAFPTPPEQAPMASSRPSDFTDASAQSVSHRKSSDKRQFQRLAARFRVEIWAGQNSFTSYTRDISLGGVRLEDPIPEWIGGYNNIEISTLDGQQSVQFVCSVVESTGSAQENSRLEFQHYQSLQLLQDWLKKYGQ